MSPSMEMESVGKPTNTAQPLLLYDGACGLCDAFVQFLVRRDSRRRFRFEPLQSRDGQRVLAQHGLDTELLATVVLVVDGRAHVRSSAALRAVAELGGAWQGTWLLLAVPRPLRDACYDYIARNRHRWFGPVACAIPTAVVEDRSTASPTTAAE